MVQFFVLACIFTVAVAVAVAVFCFLNAIVSWVGCARVVFFSFLLSFPGPPGIIRCESQRTRMCSL